MITKSKKILLTGLLFLILFQASLSETDQTVLDKPCLADENCSPPYIICRESLCKRKRIWPIQLKEIFAILLLSFLVLMATASGLGGGAIIVPILLVLMEFNTKQSVALSNGIIFFVSIFKSAFSLHMKHPTIPHRTLIDHNLVIIFISTILFGLLIGTTLSEILPDIVQMVGLIMIVIYSLYRGLGQSCKIYKRENEEKKKKKLVEEEKKKKEGEEEKKYEGLEIPNDENDRINELNLNQLNSTRGIRVTNIMGNSVKNTTSKLTSIGNSPRNYDIPVKNSSETKDTSLKKNYEKKKEIKETIENNTHVHEEKLTEEEKLIQAKIRKIESTNFAPKKISIIISVLLISFLLIFLRGGKNLKSIIGVSRCSYQDGIIIFIYLIGIIFITILAGVIVIFEQRSKFKAKWDFLKDEKPLLKKQVLKLNIFGIIVGIISGVTGLGGGTILSPILLGMNYLPQVVSFTSVYLILINNFVAFVALLVSGILPLDYCISLGIVLGIGICIFEKKLAEIVKKTGRQSIVGFMFSGVLVVAFAFVVYTTIDLYIKNKQKGKNMLEFKEYCGVN